MPEEEKWPEGYLRDTVISLDTGMEMGRVSLTIDHDAMINCIEVLHGGEWQYDEHSCAEWALVDLDLCKLEDLAEFIHALIFRYNKRVAKLNETASQCPLMKSLKTIDE